ncbi:hypothetical protein FRC19_008390 [Serendipita sp. 401]|nr:hypothetical protein FRC19_008390 [Serendipita sp. 401]
MTFLTSARLVWRYTARKQIRTLHDSNYRVNGSEPWRVHLLAAIDRWARDTASPSRIYCLADVAGTGKSTIANHLSHQWEQEGRLAAKFFFSRGNGLTANASDLCIGIAQNLVLKFDALRPELKENLKDKDVIPGSIDQVEIRRFEGKDQERDHRSVHLCLASRCARIFDPPPIRPGPGPSYDISTGSSGSDEELYTQDVSPNDDHIH